MILFLRSQTSGLEFNTHFGTRDLKKGRGHHLPLTIEAEYRTKPLKTEKEAVNTNSLGHVEQSSFVTFFVFVFPDNARLLDDDGF